MSMRLYYEIGRVAFQRQLAYRTANLAGLFTNAVFGYLRAMVFVAAFQARGEIAGYSLADALQFLWATQAFLMVIALWGWYDIDDTIRTGDVISDLSKPFSYLGYWLARDYGRAAYFLLFRGAPIYVVGVLTFGISVPATLERWVATAVSLWLAVTVSFGWRFLLNMTAFWTIDSRGISLLAMAVATLLSGLIVPLPFLPDGVREIALALPFAAILQTPADVMVGRVDGAELVWRLTLQALWAVGFLIAAQLVVRAATRRVIVQGG